MYMNCIIETGRAPPKNADFAIKMTVKQVLIQLIAHALLNARQCFSQLVSVHDDLSAMEQDLEELETQRLESEKERSVLQAQYDESSVKQELLQQQKIRLQQEKFIVQVLS